MPVIHLVVRSAHCDTCPYESAGMMIGRTEVDAKLVPYPVRLSAEDVPVSALRDLRCSQDGCDGRMLLDLDVEAE